jgi:hypothetical protein
VQHTRESNQAADSAVIVHICRVIRRLGECSESAETIATYLDRTPRRVKEAFGRIRDLPIFDVRNRDGKTLIWQLRPFPAARALCSPNIWRVLRVLTGDTSVTSDTSVTGDASVPGRGGPVTPPSPVPVTLPSPEEESFKEESLEGSRLAPHFLWVRKEGRSLSP